MNLLESFVVVTDRSLNFKLLDDSSLDAADNFWSRFFNKDDKGFIELFVGNVGTELINQSLLLLKEVTSNLAVLIVFSGDLVL